MLTSAGWDAKDVGGFVPPTGMFEGVLVYVSDKGSDNAAAVTLTQALESAGISAKFGVEPPGFTPVPLKPGYIRIHVGRRQAVVHVTPAF